MEVVALLPQEEFLRPLQTQVAKLPITIVHGEGMRKMRTPLTIQMASAMEIVAALPIMVIAGVQTHAHLVHPLILVEAHPEVHSIPEVAIQVAEAAVEVVVQVAEVQDHHLQDLDQHAETTKHVIHFG